MEELSQAVKNMKNGKAVDFDGMPPEAVKIVAECSPKWLLDPISKILELHEFPDR